MSGCRLRAGSAAKAAALALVSVVLVLASMAAVAGGQEVPPPGTAGTPRTPGVTVEASLRWGGVTTPGAWTTYLVKMRNEGPDEVQGAIFLVPEPHASRPAPMGRAGSRQRRSLDDVPLSPGHVIRLGEVEVTLPAEPRLPGPTGQAPAAPAAVPPTSFPIYRAPVSLAAGTEKTLNMVVLEAPYGHRAELRGRHGRTIAVSASSFRPEAEGQDAPPTVALLSQVSDGAASGGVRDSMMPRPGDTTALTSRADLPDNALELSGLKTLVIAGFDTASLSQGQVRSVADYVALGGGLVLGGGTKAEQTLRHLPEHLVPLRPTGTVSASLAPLADLAGRTTAAASTVVTGELRRGRSVLEAQGGVPLVVQADYGAGRVVQLTYDPLVEPLASDPFLQDLAWDQGLSRAASGFGLEVVSRPATGGAEVSLGSAPLGSQVLGQQLWSLVTADRGWPPWPRRALWLLVGYAVLVFPFASLGLRRWRRQGLLWAMVPAVAVVFGAVVIATAATRDGGGQAVVVQRPVPGGTVLASSHEGITAIGRGERRVALSRGAAVSSVFGPPTPVAVTKRPALGRQLPEPPVAAGGGGVVTYGTDRPEVSLRDEPGAMRHVQRLSLTQRPGLESKLRIVGTGLPELGGVGVTGTVVNRSSTPIHQLRAQLPGGAQAKLADVISPGQSLSVDARFVWPRSRPAGSGRRASEGELVMYAAADKAFTRTGQVAIVGLGRIAPGGVSSPVGGGRGEETSVVVEVVALEASENLVALLDGAQLVSSISVSPTDTVNVYDLGGLPGIGPLNLAYALVSDAEVYDWARGTWRRLPRQTSPTLAFTPLSEPLADSEVNNGLVRVRDRVDKTANFGLDLSRYQLEMRAAPAR